MASWQGTDYNERLLNSVRNGLVGIYLDGVKGVSPDRGEARRMVPPADADRIIAKARVVYAKLVDQKAPRAVKVSASAVGLARSQDQGARRLHQQGRRRSRSADPAEVDLSPP